MEMTPNELNHKVTMGWLQAFRDEAPDKLVGKFVTTGRMRLSKGNKQYISDCIGSAFLECEHKIRTAWESEKVKETESV
jgi:hypothetical protein